MICEVVCDISVNEKVLKNRTLECGVPHASFLDAETRRGGTSLGEFLA